MARKNSQPQPRKRWKQTMESSGNPKWGEIESGPIVLEKEGTTVTGKEAANVFIKQYAGVSDIEINKDRRRQVNLDILELKEAPHGLKDTEMDRKFTNEELEQALRELKMKKSPGPDQVTNEMLVNLGNEMKRKLLQLFNTSWRSGRIPQAWKEATMTPIHKQGKSKDKAESYRPISLLSCLCKTMERMVNTRLTWYLENNNILIEEQAVIPKGVNAALYADDLAIWTTEENIRTAKVRLQNALENLNMWTQDWIMKANAKKTTFTIFTLSTKKPTVTLTLDGQKLIEENNPKYLGITFDPRLTWKTHIDTCHQKGLTRTCILRKLAGLEWGADSNILKKTYTGYVRPVLEYGVTSWGMAAKSNVQKVISVQNQNLRIITGGMKSTPIRIMESQSQIESMLDRRDRKLLTERTKYKAQPTSKMHKRINNLNKGRLKRSSFAKESKLIETENEIIQEIKNLTPLETHASTPPWEKQPQIEIRSHIRTIEEKLEVLRGAERQQLAKGFKNAVQNTQSLVLQWIPAHCGIEGNERADSLAKEGSQLEQIERDLMCSEVKTIIKNSMKNKWKESHPEFNRQDGVHQLDRRGQTTIFRLRTGHNRLRHHMNRVFKVGETNLCSCGEAAETAEHVLQNCQTYDALRQSIWNEAVDMTTKLYGPPHELERMAAFIAKAGIAV
ncbi:hypothetical protein RRG08_056456 [Elysia crispata]|uniref:RNase H type-1 domain-containing protein n=1 Tax=Elysia crispata TaxID=231223 RepID=A0AAE0ZD48_9GAST|nr:hypothetical protein RRG08_056456 [Elysia crispata]